MTIRCAFILLCLTAFLHVAAGDKAPRPPTERDRNLARYGPWRSSRIGGGGYLQQFWFTSDPSILYLSVDVAGVYRSDDGGGTWRAIHGSAERPPYFVRSMLTDPRDPDWLLIAVGAPWEPRDGLRLTTDGGRTWTRVLHKVFVTGWRNGFGHSLARSPNDFRGFRFGRAVRQP